MPWARRSRWPLLHRYGLPVRSAANGARPTLTTNAWLRFDTIRRDLETAKPQTVLEVGAGEGGLGSWLASRFTYTGVEPDARSRAAAGARFEPGHGRIVESLDAVGDQQFDAVCAFEVLEHIGEDRKALEQWREYLRPVGLAAVERARAPGSLRRGRRARRALPALRAVDAHRGLARCRLRGRAPEQLRRRSRARAPARSQRCSRSASRPSRPTQRDTPEERSSGSGRFMQPRRKAVAIACATIAAPGRLVQRPFAATDVGTGYVVLAPSIGVTPRRVLVIGTFDPDDASLPPVAAAPRPARATRSRCATSAPGAPIALVRRLAGPDAAARASRGLLAGRCATSRPANDPTSSCSSIPGHLDVCVLGPIAGSAAFPQCSTSSSRCYDTVSSTAGLRSPRSPVALATRALDVLACWSVPMVVVDTPEHADFFARFTHRARKHFAVLWVGAEESRFRAAPDPGDDACILWYLTYIPLHGFETVARAVPRCSPTTAAASAWSVTARNVQPPRSSRATSGSPTSSSRRRSPENELAAEIAPRRRSASACSERATRRRGSCRTRCSSARPRAARSSPRQPRRSTLRSATHS